MSKNKLKIKSGVVETSNLIKKYSHYFEECAEDKNYLRIRKDFPFTMLEDEDLRFVLYIMLAVHCDEDTEGKG